MDNNDDVNDDYEYSRKKYKKLIDDAEDVLPALIELAKESESPRVFEVLSTMMGNMANMTDKLMELQKKKKDILQQPKGTEAPPGLESPTKNVTNNVFIGNTADLQKMLIQQQQKNVIDIAVNDDDDNKTTNS